MSSLKLKNWPFPEAGSVEMLGSLPKLTQLVLDSEGLGTKVCCSQILGYEVKPMSKACLCW